jgi:tetratricopeptide (TPR) repeat protein
MMKTVETRNPDESRNLNMEAIKHFKAAISIYPYLHNTWHDIGRAYLNMGDDKHALAAFKQAFKLDADFPDSGMNAAMITYNLGNSEESITILKEVILKHPDLEDGYRMLGEILMDTGSFGEAHSVFAAALEANSNWTWAAEGQKTAEKLLLNLTRTAQ